MDLTKDGREKAPWAPEDGDWVDLVRIQGMTWRRKGLKDGMHVAMTARLISIKLGHVSLGCRVWNEREDDLPHGCAFPLDVRDIKLVERDH